MKPRVDTCSDAPSDGTHRERNSGREQEGGRRATGSRPEQTPSCFGHGHSELCKFDSAVCGQADLLNPAAYLLALSLIPTTCGEGRCHVIVRVHLEQLEDRLSRCHVQLELPGGRLGRWLLARVPLLDQSAASAVLDPRAASAARFRCLRPRTTCRPRPPQLLQHFVVGHPSQQRE